MQNIRIIPRLDIKGTNLVKGIHLEGLRVVGKPEETAQKYYQDGADEILFIDIVASLYGRNNLLELIRSTVQNVFIPLTVGGGIRNVNDIRNILRAGADKVAINTAVVNNPSLITEAAETFGSQCVVVSIETIKTGQNRWEIFTENGREKTGIDALEWAERVCDLGAGEILLTSIDREGTKKGYEIDLVRSLAKRVPIPVIACGGAGNPKHVRQIILEGSCDAVSMASVLHYDLYGMAEIKAYLQASDIPVRQT